MTEFYLVRHGATRMNKQAGISVDKERGWSDVPLTKEGRAEAHKAGMALRGKGIEHVSASPLTRAHETAVVIGHHLGVHPTFDPDLRPWHLGDMTGQEINKVQPQMEDYARNKPDKPVPGGESFNTFKRRAFGGVGQHIKNAGKHPSLLVSHHRVERLLAAYAKAGQPDDGSIDLNEFFKDGDPPGGVIKMNLDADRLARLGSKRGSRNMRGGDVNRPAISKVETRASQLNAPETGSPQKPTPGVPDHRSHALAIGGAHHLHKAGHITKAERDRFQKKARAAMVMRAALQST